MRRFVYLWVDLVMIFLAGLNLAYLAAGREWPWPVIGLLLGTGYWYSLRWRVPA